MTLLDRAALLAVGTSPAAIARHYDLPHEFYKIWLGPELVYSCALWDEADDGSRLDRAQQRKLDFFGEQLNVKNASVLDIGCGWGALLARFHHAHQTDRATGLTLSASQAAYAQGRAVPNVDYRLEHWADHEPLASYDAITCIEATEHLVNDDADADTKVAVYRTFFERCASWLRDEGRVGLQLICLDNVSHAGSRAGRGPMSELIRTEIFPESMPASLSELVLGWETWFSVQTFLQHGQQYWRTFRAWGNALRAQLDRARELVGDEEVRRFQRYFATGEVMFRLREDNLYRVILRKRAAPKSWRMIVKPSHLASSVQPPPSAGASIEAVQAHYDVANDFYRTFLGPTMLYTSGWWDHHDGDDSLDAAVTRKVDRFADIVLPKDALQARVLDVGCGWGFACERLVRAHQVHHAVGLTLSSAQVDWCRARAVPGVEIRLENWRDHDPPEPYDAMLTFGAFEHFAHDGATSLERIGAYRAFFEWCWRRLRPSGRMGLESIVYDDAPDTDQPLGRGPLGDSVLQLYPESTCPHLSEIVLGFEPWFEIEMLRCDGDDFARTTRAWHVALRHHADEAAAGAGCDSESVSGGEIVQRFIRYLVASEVQFRLGVITNVRLVLTRRELPKQ